MILILASAVALISEPVVCDLTAQGRNIDQRGPNGFTAACPADHPDAAAIQAAAEASIAAMDLPLPRLRRQDGNPAPMVWAADQLTMQVTDGVWQPAPGQSLVQTRPYLPSRAVAQGAVHMHCALAFNPDARGVDEQPEVSCISNLSTQYVTRLQTAAMAYAASLWRFAPVGMSYCLDEQVEVTVVRIHRDTGRHEPTPPAPDPALLPNLCEAG